MNARGFDRLAAHAGKRRLTQHMQLRAWLWLLLWAAIAAAAGALVAYAEVRGLASAPRLSVAVEPRSR